MRMKITLRVGRGKRIKRLQTDLLPVGVCVHYLPDAQEWFAQASASESAPCPNWHRITPTASASTGSKTLAPIPQPMPVAPSVPDSAEKVATDQHSILPGAGLPPYAKVGFPHPN